MKFSKDYLIIEIFKILLKSINKSLIHKKIKKVFILTILLKYITIFYTYVLQLLIIIIVFTIYDILFTNTKRNKFYTDSFCFFCVKT